MCNTVNLRISKHVATAAVLSNHSTELSAKEKTVPQHFRKSSVSRIHACSVSISHHVTVRGQNHFTP
ncbi:hypothetical protein CW304_30070 [Bacillus sp. UFRGS-B20]|nr:hypothetical protein CW304_30070 [Bacillus sp. UFRGS-B20]